MPPVSGCSSFAFVAGAFASIVSPTVVESSGMRNAELAKVFERIGDLLEIDGADRFRVNSYRKVARALDDASEDVVALAAAGRLDELPGVGKSSAERIAQFLKTGHVDVLDELEAKLPKGLPDLLSIQGVGPKKIGVMHKELGVASIDDLKRVIANGELEKLAGFGATSVKKIAEGIAFLASSGGRTPLGVALPIARAFAERVRGLKGVRRVEIAGSLRRGAETIGDIDLLCDAADGERIIKEFTAFDGVKRVLASGGTKGSVTVDGDAGQELQVDLRVVDSDSFGAALQYFTGSKAHNVRLREMAIKKKWRLNEYGLQDGEKRIAGKTEAEIYTKLGLPLIPPELREDRGEFDAEAVLDVVTLDDIRGDLHMHTVASDGRNTIEEMALAGKARGYEYIAICDHSKSSTIANGLSIERMKEHIKAIQSANKKVSGITILVGCECDILPDGSMDYPDDLLAECDWVVASIHSAMGPGGSGKLSPTERTIRAMENAYVCQIAHPTGRLINRRPAMELDMAAVAAAAVDTKTLLEINSSWQRLDLKDLHARQTLAAGADLVINTDAHSVDGLEQMSLGVTTGRRSGATRARVANCGALASLRKRVSAKRGS